MAIVDLYGSKHDKVESNNMECWTFLFSRDVQNPLEYSALETVARLINGSCYSFSDYVWFRVHERNLSFDKDWIGKSDYLEEFL